MSTLRGTFDADAERYDRTRPQYPDQLVDDLAAAAGANARILESGCGTGQLTVALARRGMRVTAVELGPGLAAVARRNLAAYPGSAVHVSALEDWQLPAEPFDALVAATSWHWLDPVRRLQIAAAALRPGGLLGIVGTAHVAGGTEEFFAEVQHCYERWDPSTPPGLRLTAAADVPPDTRELVAAADFTDPEMRRYEADIGYTAAEYIDVIGTYSPMIALPAERRTGLFDDIRTLIEQRYAGRIVKRYLFETTTARRR